MRGAPPPFPPSHSAATRLRLTSLIDLPLSAIGLSYYRRFVAYADLVIALFVSLKASLFCLFFNFNDCKFYSLVLTFFIVLKHSKVASAKNQSAKLNHLK